MLPTAVFLWFYVCVYIVRFPVSFLLFPHSTLFIIYFSLSLKGLHVSLSLSLPHSGAPLAGNV